jgi:CBS domain containing-hemolysin-like protein
MVFFLVILLSLLLSAFFSGMEIAYLSANRFRIELEKKKGNASSRIIDYFIQRPGNYLSTILVGNNIAVVVYGLMMSRLFVPILQAVTGNHFFQILLNTIFSTLIILFVSEFIPKALFRVNPNRALTILAIPVFLFHLILIPVSSLITLISNALLRLFWGIKKAEIDEKALFSRLDLDSLLNDNLEKKETEEEEEHEVRIFRNALDFSKVKIRDCMVPRTEIVAVDENTTIEALSETFISTGYSKVLVFEKTIDNVIGYVSSKELFKNPKSILSIVIKPIFVPQTMPANKLLGMLLQEHKSIAVVVDEFGGTSGIVTIEDIIEVIFGEIEDEHDTADFIERRLNDGSFVFSGRLEIDYLNEHYDLEVPVSNEYQTLAGYVMSEIGRIPKSTEQLVTKNFTITVLKVTNTRIELVRLKSIEKTP